MTTLNPRTILVTGASKGIGRAAAQRLARDGFSILVHYGKDRKGGEDTLRLVEAEKASGRLISFDISDRDECRQKLEDEIAVNGSLYGVILNAGITRDNVFPAFEDKEWDDVLNTNLGGFYNVLRPVIMPMVSARAGGRIVTLSSIAGLSGNRGQVNYSASKAGIIGATKALAVELAKRKITVNCVAPGVIETQMTEGAKLEDFDTVVPLRRMGTVDEVAAAISFFCSDGASYVTRQVLAVNGGMI